MMKPDASALRLMLQTNNDRHLMSADATPIMFDIRACEVLVLEMNQL